jgi:3-deoxy-D-manno-octulosonic-acid transferase
MAIIMETEIWPNLFVGCDQNNIPIALVNARLSDKSVAGYRLLPALIKPALASVDMIATQTGDDRDRYIALGANANKVQITGNIKFDMEIAKDLVQQSRQLRQTIFHGRLVWIIASTHKGEDEVFLDLYKQLKKQFPSLLLVLVPRHPERFGEVKSLCNKQRLRTLLRTAKMPCHDAVDVYIGDTMGELKLLYAAADISFVGGSMVPVGGHNVLEPAAIGVPVMFGPFMANFKEITQGLLAQGAAIQCQDREQIITAFRQLAEDQQHRQQLVVRGREFVAQNQGALARVVKLLARVLTSTGNNPVAKIS